MKTTKFQLFKKRISPKSKESGTTSVEFALVVLVFFMLTLGLLDVGQGVWAYHSLAHATREGARFAIVHGDRADQPATETSVATLVKSRIPNLAGVTVNTTWLPNNSQASTVEVTAQYTYNPIMPLYEFTIPISASARMAVSY